MADEHSKKYDPKEDQALPPHSDLMSMFDGEENPTSSLSSPPEDIQSLIDIHRVHTATANNELNLSSTLSAQGSETIPHEVDRLIDEPASLPPADAPLKGKKMSYQGVDLTAEAGESSTSVSWHEPHPIFVIILVGPEEHPFGIQKDLLCAQSPYYREEFAKGGQENSVELIVKLPDTDVEAFGCFQNFIYTGSVYDKARNPIPDYPLLMGVWKLATRLRMAPLRVAVLDVMNERRQQTSCIPGTPLLVQAWKETEEGSGLRTMLITWAAEHMRASPEIRNAFAKSLPQEILSELVIVMSDLPAPSHPPTNFIPQAAAPFAFPPPANRVEIDVEPARPSTKRSRKSDVGLGNADEAYEIKPSVKKVARRSEPNNRRKSKVHGPAAENPIPLSADKEMNFCRDLIFRMLSGPGYWTRLVGPFRNPVDPVADNVPNYLTVVKRPMDLITIRDKMARGEYRNATEFESDVRQIFQNCYEYWTEKDPIFDTCLKFEQYFNEKWNTRHKWVAPTIKAEVID